MDSTAVDFRTNTNPLGSPRISVAKLASLRASIEQYPAFPSWRALSVASKVLRIPQRHLAIGVGATEFIFLVSELCPLGEGIVFQPTFWEYKESLVRARKRVLEVPTAETTWYQPSSLQVPWVSRRPVKAIFFICNPNNPTGRLYERDSIVALAERNPKSLVIVDETYLLFRSDYAKLSLTRLAARTSNLIVITSFSKFFALPGLRVGTLCATEERIRQVRSRQIPYGIGSFSEEFVRMALPNPAYVAQSRRMMTREREWIARTLDKIECLRVVPTDANFWLAHLERGNIENLASYLQARGLLVRSGAEFSGLDGRWIRVAIRNRHQTLKLVRALDEVGQ